MPNFFLKVMKQYALYPMIKQVVQETHWFSAFKLVTTVTIFKNPD